MKKVKACKFFIWPTLALLAISGLFLLAFSRTEIHYFLNQFHAPAADWLFKYITHLGDGAIFALALPLAFLKNLRWFFVILLTGALVLFTTGLLKQWIFHGLPRPVKFFGAENLYLVPGVEMHGMNSFPSGHTMAAFAFYFTLCFLLNNRVGSVILFVLAVLVGYSRIYLSQHFLIDVFVGSILGVVCGYLAIAIINSWKWSTLDVKLQDVRKRNA